MASQLYPQQGDGEYRLVAKHGLGALIFTRPDYAATAEEHEHPEAQISILFGGNAPSLAWHSSTGRTTRTRVNDGSFIYIPSGEPHRLNWKGRGSLVNLYMAPDYLHELSEEIGCAVRATHLAKHQDRGICEIGRFLLDEYEMTRGLSNATVDHATALIASRMFRVTEQLERGQPTGVLSLARIQPAIDSICDSPERDFTLLTLARLCHSSVFHFARSFSAHVGLAPFAFQRSKRLEKAKVLLKGTGLSIGSVAWTVGTHDAAHFTKSFRRETGYTPREYRHLQAGQTTPGGPSPESAQQSAPNRDA